MKPDASFFALGRPDAAGTAEGLPNHLFFAFYGNFSIGSTQAKKIFPLQPIYGILYYKVCRPSLQRMSSA